MKKLIQLFLILFLGLIIFYTYKEYFFTKRIISNENLEINMNTDNKNIVQSPEKLNNTIKKLKYEVKLSNNNQYSILADESEIKYENNVEFVYMKKVFAIFIDEKNKILEIEADNAFFNNQDYNTVFEKNIKIKYLDSIILANKVDLIFTKNKLIITDNIFYQNKFAKGLADIIKIDLLNKNFEIFMHDSKDNIRITLN